MKCVVFYVLFYILSVTLIKTGRTRRLVRCADPKHKCITYKNCRSALRKLQSDNDYDVKQAQLKWCDSDGPNSPKVCCKDNIDEHLPSYSTFVAGLPVGECGYSNLNMLNRSAKVFLDSLDKRYSLRNCLDRNFGRNRFSRESRVKRMGGGRQSRIGQWPWVVMIMNDFHLFIVGKLHVRAIACLGAIINDQFIVTVGSCVHDLRSPSRKPFVIYAGLFDLDNRGKFRDSKLNKKDRSQQAVNGFMFDEGDDPQEMFVDKVFPHPDMKLYDEKDNSTIFNNIALVQLKKRLRFNSVVQPICLPLQESEKLLHADPNHFRHMTVASYGQIEQSRGSPYRYRFNLRHAHVPVVDAKLCNVPGDIGESIYCVGGLKDPLLCSVDEGAPLMASSEDGRMHLIGLLMQERKYNKRRDGCYVDQRPSMFVNIKSYIPFIKKVLDAEYKPQQMAS